MPDPTEQRVLALARRLAPGRSLCRLAAELARRGYLARNGRPFAPEVLRRLVTDRAIGDSAARARLSA